MEEGLEYHEGWGPMMIGRQEGRGVFVRLSETAIDVSRIWMSDWLTGAFPLFVEFYTKFQCTLITES